MPPQNVMKNLSANIETFTFLFLELGVGFNTPGIIKYPFMQMTAENPKAIYACINMNEAYARMKLPTEQFALTETSEK